MPRRRHNQGSLEDFAESFRYMPWWAGVGCAALLLGFSVIVPHVPASGLLLTTLLMFVPWILWITAALVLLYTAMGIVSRAVDRRRFDRTEDVGRLDAFEYERYVGEYYRRKGYSVTQRGGARADGGVDLVIAKDRERLLVQCKHWKAFRVGPQPLRELWGLVDHEKAAGAVFVTSKDFTTEARAFAAGKRLELVDGIQLAALVAVVKSRARLFEPGVPAGESSAATRICPDCGAPMVVRTAQRGPRTGERFLGCSTYPKCRCVLPLEPKASVSA